MGVPALSESRKTDQEAEQTLAPVRPFSKIDGDETAERFTAMLLVLDKNRAAQFWGVEKEWAVFNGGSFRVVVSRPNTIDSKLLSVKYALREVPNPDEFTDNIARVITAKEVILGSRRISRKRIMDHSTGKSISKPPMTYGDAHDTPEIRNQAVTALRESGDPVTEIIRSLEEWRLTNSSISVPDAQLRVGRETFRSILLSSEESPYVIELGRAATTFVHKTLISTI